MNKEIYKIKKGLSALISKQENRRLRYYYNDSIYNSNFLFIDNIIKSKEINESPYKDILLNYFIKSEKIMPSGSFVLAKMYLEAAKEKSLELESIEKSIENIFQVIDQNIFEEKYKNLLKNILLFSGPDSSIVCEKTENESIEIVKKQNAVFKVNIHPDFENVYFSNQKEMTKNFKAIVMDAYIERESEIMPLIDEAFKHKQPLVVLCRGMSDNCTRNLKSILLKNKISVFPYIVKFDDKDPFILSDISAMFENKIFSVESGDNIAKNILEKSCNKTFKITKSSIEFEEECLDLKNAIEKKILECSDDELKKYLVFRKKRITSNTTYVYVPKKDVKLLNDIKSIVFLYNRIVTSNIGKYDHRIYPESCLLRIKGISTSMNKTINSIKTIIKERTANE
jgi:hypothetical protein